MYVYPVYAHVRRRGNSRHDAEDLTQSFFAGLLDGRLLATASPDRGRFRSYILMALDRFLVNQYQHDRAAMRGGMQHDHDRHRVVLVRAAHNPITILASWRTTCI